MGLRQCDGPCGLCIFRVAPLMAGSSHSSIATVVITVPATPTATVVIIVPAAPAAAIVITVPATPAAAIVITVPAAPAATIVIVFSVGRAATHVTLVAEYLRERRKSGPLTLVKAVVEWPLRICEARQRSAHTAESLGALPHPLHRV